ncbi:MAG: hypothetical protein MI867_03775, partial [Pseudomonadales bacterium]|nr:hypothetical protein [Pseudomonadales bacterium]
YIANRPPLPDYEALAEYRSMLSGEIAFIASETGNHWRKVFNVYAKLAFLLDSQGYATWQELRDQSLLQVGSAYGLFFSPPSLKIPATKSQSGEQPCIHLVLGKSYANSLGLESSIQWVEDYIGAVASSSLWVVPYFDYRQFSDHKLKTFSELLKAKCSWINSDLS